jgi:hypothetical protein
MRSRAKILATGVVSGAAMALAVWLFNSDVSPAHQYAIWHPDIGNALTQINLPAVFLGIVASGNVHQPSEVTMYLGIFVLWALVGSVVAWAVLRKSGAKGDA